VAELLQIDSPWTCEAGVVRVLRYPGESTSDTLTKRMDRDGMTRPYIFDTPHERRLHFTHEATQSAMSLHEPDALISAYTRKMMAFLLMNPNPRHILMIGLGGGSLAKFCYRHLPKTRITVVELSADVIAMRDEFLIPNDDARFRVVHDDGARYVQNMSESIDVLLIDAFDEDGIATTLANSSFYASAARLLTKRGVMVMNLWGKPKRYVANVEHATAAFGRHVLLMTVPGEANVLMFASRRALPKSITGDLETIAAHLQRVLQLDFPRYLRRICQGQALAAG
jgi:spermidine synthase